MAIKYWQVKFEGAKSLDEVHAAVGRAGANIVRVHVQGGETQVYLAGDESLQQHVVAATKGAGTLKQVRASDVTKFS
jgi:hypothetical protein